MDDGFIELSKKYFDGMDDKCIKDKMFSNRRMVRNLFERVWSKAGLRFQMDDSMDNSVLIENYLEKGINDADFSLLTTKQNTYKIGF